MPSVSPFPPSRAGARDFFTGAGLPLRSLGLMFKTRQAAAAEPLLVGRHRRSPSSRSPSACWPIAGRIAARLIGEGTLESRARMLVYLLLVSWPRSPCPTCCSRRCKTRISEATEARCGDFTAPPFSFARLAVAGTSIALHGVSPCAHRGRLLRPPPARPASRRRQRRLLRRQHRLGRWWLTAEYLSGPMARHLHAVQARARRDARAAVVSLGFGLALYVMLWVPVLNFFLVPIAVVGGTLLVPCVAAPPSLKGQLP